MGSYWEAQIGNFPHYKLIQDLARLMDESEEEESEEEKPKRRAPPKKAPPKKKKAASDSEAESASEGSGSDEDYRPKGSKGKKAKKGKAGKKKKGSDSDDGSDEDWKASKSRKSGGGKKGGGKGGSGRGYARPLKLSPELSELVGEETAPRHEVVKRVWALIKERNLYDPKNKQFAICDDQFYKVFGVKRFRTFGMMKLLKDHFITE